MLRTRNTKRKTRGWVPYGYNYLGPGNDLHRGKPTNRADRAAQKHDWRYHEYEKQGKRPKLVYNQADEEFINEVGEDSPVPWIAKKVFQAKRKVADWGFIHDIRPSEANKLHTSDWPSFERLTLQSTSSVTSTSAAMANSGSGNEHGLTETKVDKVNPYKVFRGPPNYTFASLPFQYDAQINDLNTYARDHTFRMTSPYDPLNTVASSNINVGAGSMLYRGPLPDASDSVQRKANWFDYYSGLYKYYHTISCEYTVFIENYGAPMWVYFFNINDTAPPGTASNTDMQLWNDCEYHYVNSLFIGTEDEGTRAQGIIPREDNADTPMENSETAVPSGSTNPASVTIFTTGNNVTTRSGTTTLTKYGQYSTGDYNREIRLDADVENWTDVSANPKLPEKLVIRVKPQSNVIEGNSARDAGDDLRYRLRVQINYLVEFKELDYKIRYPVVTQPITVSLFDTQTGRS